MIVEPKLRIVDFAKSWTSSPPKVRVYSLHRTIGQIKDLGCKGRRVGDPITCLSTSSTSLT